MECGRKKRKKYENLDRDTLHGCCEVTSLVATTESGTGQRFERYDTFRVIGPKALTCI